MRLPAPWASPPGCSGKNGAVIWSERYRAQAAEIEAAGAYAGGRIDRPNNGSRSVFSPDGRSLAYITWGKDLYPALPEGFSLGRRPAAGSGGISPSRPAWSPSGRQLVYAKPDILTGKDSKMIFTCMTWTRRKK